MSRKTARRSLASIIPTAFRPAPLSNCRTTTLLAAPATEEIVRWATPVMYFRRNVTRDTEIRGHRIAAGDKVAMYYISGNRDEEVFDDPFTFDIRRQPNDHVAFGFGTHFCLGASLARLEIRALFEELVRRVPKMHLAAGAEPTKVPSAFACAYDAIPVEIG